MKPRILFNLPHLLEEIKYKINITIRMLLGSFSGLPGSGWLSGPQRHPVSAKFPFDCRDCFRYHHCCRSNYVRPKLDCIPLLPESSKSVAISLVALQTRSKKGENTQVGAIVGISFSPAICSLDGCALAINHISCVTS